jgi:hypothetical protein
MDAEEAARLVPSMATVLQQQQVLMERLAARPPPERKVEGFFMSLVQWPARREPRAFSRPGSPLLWGQEH